MRFLRAFLLAPLAAPTIFWAWRGIAGLLEGEDRRRAVLNSPLRELGVAILFGAPVAYLAALAALAIGFRLLRMQGARGAAAMTVLGAAVGVATTVVMRPHLGGDPFRLVLTPLQGAVMGSGSAAFFWALWTPWRTPPG